MFFISDFFKGFFIVIDLSGRPCGHHVQEKENIS